MQLLIELQKARTNLWNHQVSHKYFPDINIHLNDVFSFNFKTKISPIDVVAEPYLKCYLEPDILKRLLHRKYHWNSLELACLITFNRKPNIYMHDVHSLMSFFCLPKEMSDVSK